MAPEFKNSVIVFRGNVYIIHYFEPEVVTSDQVMVIVPPHAGRHGNVAQRMIDTCVAYGRRTYTFELLTATSSTRNTSINDLKNIIMHIYEIAAERHSVPKIDLVGLCQGAWLSAVFTAKHPELVNRYANFAGPINTHSDGKNIDGSPNKIEDFCMNYLDLYYQRWVVMMNGGIQPGMAQWFSFSMVSPGEVYIGRWMDEFFAVMRNDKKLVQKLRRNREWYDYPMDLAGVWFLDCLENHFRDNRLYNGTWVVGGDPVNLANITCPVYLYAGGGDLITHWKQVYDMKHKVSSEQVKFTLFPFAGHTKVFVGTEELNQFAQDFFG